MSSRRADLLDAVLAVAALAAVLLAARQLDVLPPEDLFEGSLVGIGTLAHVVAVALLLVRGDRRALGVTCLAVWLLVLVALPAYLIGLYFTPGALLLTLALYRPRRAATTSVPG